MGSVVGREFEVAAEEVMDGTAEAEPVLLGVGSNAG